MSNEEKAIIGTPASEWRKKDADAYRNMRAANRNISQTNRNGGRACSAALVLSVVY